jgi:hypothetical protein
MEMQREGMRREFMESRIGQICAVVTTAIFVSGGVYVAVHGQPWTGGAIGSLGIGGIVASFLRRRDEHEPGSNETKNAAAPQPDMRKGRGRAGQK